MQNIDLWIDAESKSMDGDITRLSFPGHSYLGQFVSFLYTHMFGKSLSGIVDTNSAIGTITPSVSSFLSNGDIGNGTLGIVVGISSSGIAIGQSALQIPIGEGTSINQCHYLANAFSPPVIVGNSSRFTITRIMLNDSGSLITLGETAIYAQGQIIGTADPHTFCLARDLIPGGLPVPNLGAATIRYTIGVTA